MNGRQYKAREDTLTWISMLLKDFRKCNNKNFGLTNRVRIHIQNLGS